VATPSSVLLLLVVLTIVRRANRRA
jgi:hypothetical protein